MLRQLILFGSIISQFTISSFSQVNDFSTEIKKFEPFTTQRFDVFLQVKNESANTPEVEWKLFKSFTDHRNIHHDRYHVYYKNRKLIGGTAIVHSKGDFVESVTGSLNYDFSNVQDQPALEQKIAEEMAAIMMQNALREKKVIADNININPSTKNQELCIIPSDFPDKTGKLILAYEVEQMYQVWQTPYRMKHYINAETGEALASIDEIVHHNVPGRGLTNFYGEVDFEHDSIGPQEFHLRDLTRGEGIFVRNNKNLEGYVNDLPLWLFEDDNDKAAIDVFYGSQQYYDLLRNRFQFNSIDNQGHPLISLVNNFLLNNAYWDGGSAIFGGGDCYKYNSFTTLDVIGHEFTHGLTDFTSNLIYTKEYGALNESISDIFGKALEYFTEPNHFSWISGHKLTKNGVAGIRSMSNPNVFGDPKYYKGMHWMTFDSGFYSGVAVHKNSGVLNFWFHLLADGGNGINEKSIPYFVKGIGMDKAFEIVFLLNTAYLTETSVYSDAFHFSKIIAEELYGESSDQYISLLEAWKAVGFPLQPPSPNKLSFTSKLNGKLDENGFECWEEPNQLTFSFTNTSQITIPKNALIKVKVSANYNYNNQQQFLTLYDDNIHLSDSILPGQSFQVPIEFSFSPVTTIISYTSSLQVTFDTYTYSNSFKKIIKYFNQPDQPEDYFRINYMYTYVSEDCSTNPEVLATVASFHHSLCPGGQYVFEFEFKNDQKSISYIDTATITPSRFYNYGQAQILNPDLSIFNGQKNIEINFYFIEGNQKYLIGKDTLSKHFREHLTQNDTINFNNIPNIGYEPRLDFDNCNYCLSGISEDQYVIVNSFSESINDCVTIEDYYDDILNNGNLANYVSDINACVNSSSMIEPYLSFELKLKVNKVKDNPIYFHNVMVFENENLISTPPINNTEYSIKKYEFPLTSMDENNIRLSVFLLDAAAYIDNIYIYDKFYSQVQNESINNSFTVTSPNISSIEIFWNHKNEKPKSIVWFDQYGNKMTEHPGIVTNIDCFSWPTGLYFYQFSILNKNFQGKVVVVK